MPESADLLDQFLKTQKALLKQQEKLVAAQTRIATAQLRAATAAQNAAELQVLLKLFDLLSTVGQGRARHNVFEWYCKIYGRSRAITGEKNKRLLKSYEAIPEDVRLVESAFDQAGVLVMQKKVNSKLFFELYALMVIRTYRALEAHVTEHQKNNPAFAVWFQQLYEEALKYYKKVLKREPEEIYCKKPYTARIRRH